MGPGVARRLKLPEVRTYVHPLTATGINRGDRSVSGYAIKPCDVATGGRLYRGAGTVDADGSVLIRRRPALADLTGSYAVEVCCDDHLTNGDDACGRPESSAVPATGLNLALALNQTLPPLSQIPEICNKRTTTTSQAHHLSEDTGWAVAAGPVAVGRSCGNSVATGGRDLGGTPIWIGLRPSPPLRPLRPLCGWFLRRGPRDYTS